MITLLIIGIVILVAKLIWWAIKAAWTIFRAVIWVVGLPFVIVGMFLVGLIKASFLVLIIAIAAAFVVPLITGD